MSEPIWRPSGERIARSRLREFMARAGDRLEREDYAALHAWSVQRPEEFWAAVWDFCGMRAKSPYRSVVQDFERMPGARWFEGAALNFADNLLRPEHRATALVFVSERGDRVEIGREALLDQVAGVAAGLRAIGVGAGDRVAGFLPNQPETVVAMLAAASLGAVWSSCSPDFGVQAVLDRFGQIEPKVLFATTGYYYNGRRIDTVPTVTRVAQALPELKAIILVPYPGDALEHPALPRTLSYADLLARTSDPTAGPSFAALPFDHPLYVLYSSGTTGRPKCIVHGAGGTLLQHQKEHVLHTDIQPGDVVFYFTTCGWMMWHWLVSGLASGATLVLYDGAPLHPDPGVLWRMAAEEAVNVFGTSAGYLRALEKTGYAPREHVPLPALRTILSTGSPLAPASYDFVHGAVGADVQLSSISGGTDIISCFALGNPMLPVYRGELQCIGLGMDVHVFDDGGRPLVGEKGELVCTSPFPSMPVGFWNDPDGRKYRAAYFEHFPNAWRHGDYAELTRRGGLIMHGRSDALLKPGGVRIGTAEIYRVVEKFPEVAESIVVGQDWKGDTRIVLFVRLQPRRSLDPALATRIRDRIRREASPRHVPAKILEVADIPRTISGKIVELAVRDTIHGRPVGNTDALANPRALEHFRNRAELME